MISFLGAVFAAVLPSPVRIALYRLQGAKIGKGASIGVGTVILADQIEIGDHSTIGHFCKIKVARINLDKRVSIGNFVKITLYELRMHSRATISPNAHISGDNNDKRSVLRLGMHTWIFSYCFINVVREVTMGRNVGVGGGTYLFTHGYWLNKLDGFPVTFGQVTIKDNVWLPWGCFIMPGVTIEENVIIGARSVVNRSLPKNALAVGSPAKVIREKSFRDITQEDKIQIITESVEEFAASIGRALTVRDTIQIVEFDLDDVNFLVLHKEARAQQELRSTSLNVFFAKISKDQWLSHPCLSLKDYTSSCEDMIPTLARQWLQSSRAFGMRYYPIDEMPEDEAFETASLQ